MRQVHNVIILGMLFATLSLASMPARAATSVGKVIVSIGHVIAVDAAGKERALKRRSKLFAGDTIRLAEESRLQARFIDNQLVALKQNTVFRIDEYEFNGKQDGSESAAMSLLKGGMRSVTGAIGQLNKKNYKVKTPVATLGVRGTIWNGHVCHAGSCGSDIADGFYGAVSDGAVVISNQGGEQVFSQDQFFHVPTPMTAPTRITNPPAIVVENEALPQEEVPEAVQEVTEETVEESSEAIETLVDETTDTTTETLVTTAAETTTTTFTSGTQTTQTTTTGTTTVSGSGTPLAGVLAPTGAGVVVAGIVTPADAGGTMIVRDGGSDSFEIATINGVGNQFVSFKEYDTNCAPCTLTVYDTAVVSEQGGNGTLGVNWGRWSGTGSKLVGDNGIAETLTDSGFAFVYSPNLTTAAQLSTLIGNGAETYNFSAGPTFRDESGAIVSGSASIDVDFDSSRLTGMSISLTGNGRSYNGSFTGSVAFDAELPLSGFFCSGGACGTSTSLTGNVGGAFVGPNAEGIIGYFGLHNINQTIGVAGAGLFLR
ncbi:FecR domain-containing protein [Sulfuriflexus sp.]|uniref:FecR domain-containing protein n=1 Tax=Sulfuriflexus sp. TaxID=2015443 RepID=UPI0028CF8A08|nr:FecR domain-containing protein [Sulfuriflexus sp.]MDT8404440.1 FecR domain-containing protein [Sulfuriflexus sp.]